MTPPIADTAPSKDTGAETLARYRYQFAYAALLATDFFSDAPEFKEIFCEHWEDILVRRMDDTYVACQVKTRDTGYNPFVATDDKVLSALRWFCELEEQFAKEITEYRLVTNCDCWRENDTGENLEHLLDLAAATNGAVKPKLKKYLKTVSSPKTPKKRIAPAAKPPLPEELVLAVLRKTKHQRGPGLDDADGRIVRAVAPIPSFCNCNYGVLAAIAKALIALAFDASCKNRDCRVRDYFSFIRNPPEKHS